MKFPDLMKTPGTANFALIPPQLATADLPLNFTNLLAPQRQNGAPMASRAQFRLLPAADHHCSYPSSKGPCPFKREVIALAGQAGCQRPGTLDVGAAGSLWSRLSLWLNLKLPVPTSLSCCFELLGDVTGRHVRGGMCCKRDGMQARLKQD